MIANVQTTKIGYTLKYAREVATNQMGHIVNRQAVLVNYIDKQLETKDSVYIKQELLETLMLTPEDVKLNLVNEVRLVHHQRYLNEDGWTGVRGVWFDKLDQYQ